MKRTAPDVPRRSGPYSDEEVAAFTGLAPRALRELSKLGAIKTASDERGHGRRRTWTVDAVKKAAAVAALHRAGFALPMAARLLFHAWLTSSRIVNTVRGPEPWDSREAEGARHLAALARIATLAPPPRLAADPSDLVLRVYDARLVYAEGVAVHPDDDGPTVSLCLGRLADNGLTFLSWRRPPLEVTITTENLEAVGRALADPESWPRDIAAEYGHEINPDLLAYQEDPERDDRLARRLPDTFESCLAVNLTLPVRKALRRAMGRPIDDA